MKRDDWMIQPEDYKTFTKTKRIDRERELKAQKSKELVDARSLAPKENEDYQFGDSGSDWRMMKLARVFKIAQEERRDIYKVGEERFGTDFARLLEEREYLDSKAGKPSSITQFIKKKQPEKPRYEIKVEREIPVLNADELNKLSAKVIKARIMKSPNLAQLEEDLAFHIGRASNKSTKVKNDDPRQVVAKFNDSEDLTVEEMVKQEKLGAKRQRIDRQQLDFEDDENIRTKRKTERDQMKQERKDRRRLQQQENQLDRCIYCLEAGQHSNVSIIAQGTQTMLVLPQTISMVPYHCYIVPSEHAKSTLELGDDCWHEIRNFQKSLIRMGESVGQRFLFMEQVLNHKNNSHTFIECIPIDIKLHPESPGWFQQALRESEGDWTQHKPVISTTAKGFRNSMVKQVEYFHVWFDHNQGMGHVIEKQDEWPEWFGREIVANILGKQTETQLWRRPKEIQGRDIAPRIREFTQKWNQFDWTRLIE